jgi:hypothetical protein
MPKPFLPLNKIFAATIVGMSLASLLVAQPSRADVNQPFGTESDRNTNLLSPNGSDFNMLDLIHRANLGNTQWNSEQQDQQLDDAAAAFKARQKQLIQSQQQQTPAANTNPAGENIPSPIVLPQNN